jgi:4-hydroxy-tetrahydrodipicolinate synthase
VRKDHKMRTPVFIGAGTAIITPFRNGSIDFSKFAELIESQIKGGIDAIVVCGTTGEASTMPDEEHLSAVGFAVDRVNKRVPVIAGAGSNDTKHAVYLSKSCEKLGADAVLSVTPYYNKTSQAGLYEHFKTIAGSISLPVIMYNVPSRTSLNINPDTMARLALIENICAVKECNLLQMLEAKSLCPDDFAFYSGCDENVVPLLSLGGTGVISVMSNIIPAETSNMVKAYLGGRTKEALDIQIHYCELVKALFSDVNPVPLKEAMNMMGMDVGSCRLPLYEMSKAGKDNLHRVLKKYNLI